MHGLAVADRIRQLSVDVLCVNQSALYPALHRLEHQAWITATWGDSQNNRRAKFYSLTKAGHARLKVEESSWDRFRLQFRLCFAPFRESFMRLIDSLRHRLHSLLHRDASNVELAEELRFHFEGLVERNRAQGMPAPQARAAARADFGSLTEATQSTYESRGIAMAEDCAQDLRYALRSFRRQPGFAGVVVFTLALGIAACTAIFSLVNAVLLRSLPCGDANRLVYLYTPNPSLKEVPPEAFGPTIADFLDIQAQARSDSSLTMFDQKPMNLITGNEPERVGVARVDAGFFRTLEVSPWLGRGFNRADLEPGSGRSVIISHSLWRSVFAGEMNVLQREVQLDGLSYRVVG